MDVEIGSRLQSVLSVLEHGGEALDDPVDNRLFDVLAAMNVLRLEMEATLRALEQPRGNQR